MVFAWGSFLCLHVSGRNYNARYVGKELTALVEGFDQKNGFINARTEGKIQVRFPPPFDRPDWLGRFVQIRVETVKAMSMEGRYVADGFPDGSARDHA